MLALVKKLSDILRAKGLMLATAESCTGGMIAAAMTDLEGSSAVFERGFVTYSNAAKSELLGVDPALISEHGAVSEACATGMVSGALKNSSADVAVSVTGISGPGGGSDEKPVGLVYIGFGIDDDITVEEHHFSGDREGVRLQTVEAALQGLIQRL